MKINFNEVQRIELRILKEFHKYCEENNLRYSLAYGTLLGAVRHEGFIPWDNDIDVIMPRPDYRKFLELSTEKPIFNNLYVQHYSIDNKYHYICTRVCDSNTHVHVPYIREQPSKLGLWIDIFPVDGVGKNLPKLLLQKALLKWYWLLFRGDVYDSKPENSRNYFNYFIKKSALALFPNKNNNHNYKIDKICQWFPYENEDETSFLFGEEGVCKVPKSDFDSLIKIRFEGEYFFCIKHYKEFLKQCYGDYMELPKEEDRITHNIDAELIN